MKNSPVTQQKPRGLAPGLMRQNFFHLKLLLSINQQGWWWRLVLAIAVIWLQQTDRIHVMYPSAIRQPDLVSHLIDHPRSCGGAHRLHQQLPSAWSTQRNVLILNSTSSFTLTSQTYAHQHNASAFALQPAWTYLHSAWPDLCPADTCE